MRNIFGIRLARPTGVLTLLIVCFPLVALAEDSASVTFTLDFPGSDPSHYRMWISSDGHGTYDSDGKLNPEAESNSFHIDFTLSNATRSRIFDLAKRAHYFQGDLDSHKRNIASTGAKTLAYKDAKLNTQASYNYSPNQPVEELTGLLQNLSATLEFGQRLEYYHRYQKLALDEELKRMEEMWNQNGLAELQVVAPTLQRIVNDPSLIITVRSRAQRLLALSGEEPAR